VDTIVDANVSASFSSQPFKFDQLQDSLVCMKPVHARVLLFSFVTFCSSSILFSGGAFAAFFPLENVKPGLEGVAVTAGAGNVLFKFPVKVESVVQEGLDSPRILIRASGPFIESTGGIAAGMSGSPVYFKNQLAGAISAGFPNADHNLGLVTPIEIMTKAAPTPVTGTLEYYGLQNFGFEPNFSFSSLPGRPVPLAAPLTLQGLSGRAGAKLLEDFRAKGVNMTALPVQAGPVQSTASAAAKALDRPYKLEAGAPISVQLVSGDFMVGAVGTVTLVEGKNILAFGHPFLNDARARYAAAPAYVNAIVPASDIPFKLAEGINKPFGAITTDRPYAVGGTVGADPQLLPLEITVRGQTSSSIITAPVPNRTFKLGLAPVEAFTGVLAYTSALSALDATLEGSQPGSATISLAMTFKDGAGADKTITFKDRIADENDISTLAAQRAAGAVALVAENPFKAPGLQRLKLTLELAPYNLTRLVKAEPESKKVKPGQTVGINLRLQPWRSAVMVRRLSVKIPNDAGEGEYILKIRGGLTPRPDSASSSNDPWDGLLGFDDLLERLRNRISGDNVLVETNDDEPSVLEVEAVGVPVSGLLSVKFTVIGNKP
jgi:SpoIVB peptidase S55